MANNFYKISRGITLTPQASEPTGQNGDYYYNSALGEFRFYENGTWKSIGDAVSGVASVDADAIKTGDYTVLTADNGKVINLDCRANTIGITLPNLTTGFVVTIKDYYGAAGTFNVTIGTADGAEIDGIPESVVPMTAAYTCVTFVGTPSGWSRIASFQGTITAAEPAVSTGRAVFAGGIIDNSGTGSNAIDYVTIATTGNAASFGTLTAVSSYSYGASSATRGLIALGMTSVAVNTVEYITIATTGNSLDFGDLLNLRRGGCGMSNGTRAVFAGGDNGGGGADSTIGYFTIATLGNETNFGILANATTVSAGAASTTRGICAGGYFSGLERNFIQYITIATTGNATTFGTLSTSRGYLGGCSNSTRALFAGGYSPTSNVIDYITIATTGNATDFGDLLVAGEGQIGAASSIRALFAGYSTAFISLQNVIQYVTIASAGNATDFGDLTVARNLGAGFSNCHGGI